MTRVQPSGAHEEEALERQSDKVSPRQDDQLKHDTEGLVRGGHATHVEDWKGSEPSGEDQPEIKRSADGTLARGTPNGMNPDEVEARSELATYIGRAKYPLDRQALLELIMERQPPDRIVALVSALPDDEAFANMQDVWSALGGGVEERQ
jgi:hypothetical protein